MITCKLNPRVYNSLLVLLDAVRLYRVYRRLDTLSLYLYYELLIIFIVQLVSSIVSVINSSHCERIVTVNDVLEATQID